MASTSSAGDRVPQVREADKIGPEAQQQGKGGQELAPQTAQPSPDDFGLAQRRDEQKFHDAGFPLAAEAAGGAHADAADHQPGHGSLHAAVAAEEIAGR